MKRTRLFPALLFSLIAAMATAAHTRAIAAEDALLVITIGIPKAPPALPILRMIDSGALGDLASIDIAVWLAPEQLIAMVQDNRHQMVVLPLTVAAKLHNKGVGVKLVNVSTWGIGNLVSTDADVNGWSDLRGKTLFVPLRSSTPDALTRYFLEQAGMRPERDVEIVYSSMAEIGQLLRADKIANAILHEPHVSIARAGNPALRTVVAFEDEWRQRHGPDSAIPNAGLGATAAFLAEHAELAAVVDDAYAASVEWVVTHPEEAGALAEKYLGLRADAIAAAIPHLGLRYKTARQARRETEIFFTVLDAFSPELIGKKIPDATLYWR